MKKILIILSATLLLFACGSMRTVDMNVLQVGMTKSQVRTLIGDPERILFAGAADGGYEEVVQYRTYRGELYAVTYYNDHLESYEFIRDDAYPPVTTPPTYYPTPRPPVQISPGRPPVNGGGNRPGGNQTNPGTGSNRPGSGSNLPGSGSNRPGSGSNETERPRPGASETRPITKPAPTTGASRPAYGSDTPTRSTDTSTSSDDAKKPEARNPRSTR